VVAGRQWVPELGCFQPGQRGPKGSLRRARDSVNHCSMRTEIDNCGRHDIVSANFVSGLFSLHPPNSPEGWRTSDTRPVPISGASSVLHIPDRIKPVVETPCSSERKEERDKRPRASGQHGCLFVSYREISLLMRSPLQRGQTHSDCGQMTSTSPWIRRECRTEAPQAQRVDERAVTTCEGEHGEVLKQCGTLVRHARLDGPGGACPHACGSYLPFLPI
jgi:hypothetical protein